jgi:hypothetical protein
MPLLDQQRWLVWKLRNGKKPPINRHGNCIDANDERNWMSFGEACVLWARVGDGLGFALKGSGIAALDLDGCRQGVRTHDWALALGRRAQSYTELSPSSEGLHILGLATGRQPPKKLLPMPIGKLEIFRDCNRYITVTGEAIWYVNQLLNIDDVIDELTDSEPTVVAAVGKVGTVDIEACHDGWREIVLRRRSCTLIYEVQRYVQKGWRSDVIWKIGRTLRERGATRGEVAVVLRASRCFQDKWGDNANALQGEVTRIFLKPLRGCNGG